MGMMKFTTGWTKSLRIIKYIFILVLLLSAAFPLNASAISRTPPGSFLPRIASTSGELCNLLASNPRVANRFARHFGVSADQVIEYFGRNLRVSTLKDGGAYRIYFISPNGSVISRSSYLVAGERAFVTPDGKPVLLVKCGNPVLKTLPPIRPRNESRATGVIAQPELAVSSPETAPTSTVEMAMEPNPVEPSWLVAAEPKAELPVLPIGSPMLPVVSQGSNYLLPLLIGAGGLSVDRSPHTPTPEPGTLLVLTAGCISVFARMSKSKRR